MISDKETKIVNVLKELSSVISSSDITPNQIGTMLSFWIDALQKKDFSVALIGVPGKSGLLDHLYKVKKECIDDWTLHGIQLINTPVEEKLSVETLETLSRAKAVIMVIDATHVFSQAERQMVSAIPGSRQARQMIIVVDRINVIDEDEIDELRTWIKKVIEPYFRDDQGKFDEALYTRRVFYINRKDDTTLEALAEGLNSIFTQPEELCLAANASAVQVAALAAGAVQEKINEKEIQQQLVIDSLIASEQEIQQNIEDIRQQEEDFQHKAADISERIKFKIYSSLIHHLDSMYSNWEKDAPSAMVWDDINVNILLGELTSSPQIKDFKMMLNDKVQNYLKVEFDQWSANLADELSEEFTSLGELSRQPINLHLMEMQNSFTNRSYQGIGNRDIRAALQTMIQNIVLGGRSMNQIIMRLVMRAASISLLLFSNHTLWQFTGAIVGLGQEIVGARDETEKIRHDLLMKLRDTLLDNLRRALTLPGFSTFSFKNVDSFMARVGRQETLLLKAVYEKLPETVQETLSHPTHTTAEQDAFIEAFNASIKKLEHFDQSILSNVQPSPELSHIFEQGTEPERGYRLLLAEEFPDEIHANSEDLLYAKVDYQVSQYLKETQKSLKEQVSTAHNTLKQQASQTEKTKKMALEETARLQELATEVRKHLDILAVAVYGKPFTQEEMKSIYASKKLIFQPLFDG
jgi:hypothetical protein